MNYPPFFDPSKMDPKMMMELSQLVQQLSPGQMNHLQTLMHNMMAGLDVRKEMEEFEKTLPPGFREKIAGLMGNQAFPGFESQAPASGATVIDVEPIAIQKSKTDADMNLREARLTLLKAVADGRMPPEGASRTKNKLLFTSSDFNKRTTLTCIRFLNLNLSVQSIVLKFNLLSIYFGLKTILTNR